MFHSQPWWGPEGHLRRSPKSGSSASPECVSRGLPRGSPRAWDPGTPSPFVPCCSRSSQWDSYPAGPRIEHLETQVGELKGLQDQSECLGKRLELRSIWGGVLVLPPADRMRPGQDEVYKVPSGLWHLSMGNACCHLYSAVNGSL